MISGEASNGKEVVDLIEKILSNDDAPQVGGKIEGIINKLNKGTNLPSFFQLIKVKTGTEIRFVPVSEVLFFMAEDKYRTIKTGKNEFLILMTDISDVFLDNSLLFYADTILPSFRLLMILCV